MSSLLAARVAVEDNRLPEGYQSPCPVPRRWRWLIRKGAGEAGAAPQREVCAAEEEEAV